MTTSPCNMERDIRTLQELEYFESLAKDEEKRVLKEVINFIEKEKEKEPKKLTLEEMREARMKYFTR